MNSCTDRLGILVNKGKMMVGVRYLLLCLTAPGPRRVPLSVSLSFLKPEAIIDSSTPAPVTTLKGYMTPPRARHRADHFSG